MAASIYFLFYKVQHRSQISDFNTWISEENHFYYEHIYDQHMSSFLTPAEFVVCSKILIVSIYLLLQLRLLHRKIQNLHC